MVNIIMVFDEHVANLRDFMMWITYMDATIMLAQSGVILSGLAK
jgi:hypothetical protein